MMPVTRISNEEYALRDSQNIADAFTGLTYQASINPPDSAERIAAEYAAAALVWALGLEPPKLAKTLDAFDAAADFGRRLRESITDSAKEN